MYRVISSTCLPIRQADCTLVLKLAQALFFSCVLIPPQAECLFAQRELEVCDCIRECCRLLFLFEDGLLDLRGAASAPLPLRGKRRGGCGGGS